MKSEVNKKEVRKVETNVLLSVFYAPNFNEIMPFVIEERKHSRFHYDDTFTIAMRIINKYYVQYCENDLAKADKFDRIDGDFNLKSFLEVVEQCQNVFMFKRFLELPSYFGIYEINENANQSHKVRYVNALIMHKEESVFGMGVSQEVIKTSDNDPYQTAGGYRSYESEENERIYFSISVYGISLFFYSSLMIDHYNNNIAGLSTGGGTTRYEKGKEIHKRVIHTNSFDLKEVLEKHKITLQELDTQRGLAYINTNIITKAILS